MTQLSKHQSILCDSMLHANADTVLSSQDEAKGVFSTLQ